MVDFNYEILGTGDKTLLFLHGWGGNKDSFNNLISSLQYEYKIIKLDLFGFGESALPDYVDNIYDYSLELYIKLKELNLGNLSIIAHSFGGRLALILASLFDIRINSLVLIGCAGIKPKKNIKTRFKILTFKALKKLNKLKLFKVDLSGFGSRDYKDLTHDKRKLFINVVNEDLKWLLKNIKQKTLIINGENDDATPVYMAKILNKYIINSEFLLLKNTGHFCYLDCQYLINSKVINIVNNNTTTGSCL